MTEIAEPQMPFEQETVPGAGRARPLAQAGAATFAELAWWHHVWAEERATDRPSDETEAAYLAKLHAFEQEEGKIVHAYWSTRAASAVALTEKPPRRQRDPLRLRESDREIGIHRVTDWLRPESELADVLQQCDLLAIRAAEVLRGGSQRIAMRWILGVMEHVIGFIERTGGRASKEERARLVKTQTAELAKVEDFYLRVGAHAGRIVYFTGMLIGTVVVLALAGLAALPLWLLGLFDSPVADELGLLFLSSAAGMIGALVSVMARLRPGGRFKLDFEVGRRLVRRLGVFRPAVGAVFGVLLYALLQSGILLVDVDPQLGEPVYYFAVAAFLAGFSERWTHVVIGGAQRRIAPAADEEEKEED